MLCNKISTKNLYLIFSIFLIVDERMIEYNQVKDDDGVYDYNNSDCDDGNTYGNN